MKLLFVGDPHAVPSELPDCWALVGLVEKVLRVHPDAQVCWLGDQHHTHGVIHLPVMHFWLQVFERLGGLGRNIALVGNHDQAGREHVMEAYRGICRVAWPRLEVQGVSFVSYHHDVGEFLAAAGTGKTLICHQSIDGSRYENGMWVKGGVTPEQILYDHVISGHIHSPQRFGKVWYPGAPRWRTLSDAHHQDRALWLVDFVDGVPISHEAFPTAEVCRPIKAGIDTPDAPLDPDSGADWRIDICGPAEYCNRRRAELAGPGRKIKTFVTDRKKVEVRESEGLDASFRRFVESFNSPYGTPPARLKEMIAQRLGLVL